MPTLESVWPYLVYGYFIAGAIAALMSFLTSKERLTGWNRLDYLMIPLFGYGSLATELLTFFYKEDDP